MSELTGPEMVKEFFRLQYEGDYEQAFRRFGADGFTVITASNANPELTAAIPWAGYVHDGQDGYAALNEVLFGEFDVEEFAPQHFADAGDRVYVEGHFRFRHKKTGKVADSDFCCRFLLENDRIKAIQFYENTFAVAEARKD
ncbi:MAG: nuclear transport factor 2 family protein [Pseudomonadota bacterium]